MKIYLIIVILGKIMGVSSPLPDYKECELMAERYETAYLINYMNDNKMVIDKRTIKPSELKAKCVFRFTPPQLWGQEDDSFTTD